MLWHPRNVIAGRRGTIGNCMIESLEPRRMLAGLTVTVPDGGSVVFSAPDGTLVSLAFGKCSGSVTFNGTNLEQSSALNGTIVVKGDTTTVQSIDVTTSTNASSVTLRSNDPKTIPLGSFTSTGPLKSVTLKTMTLEGNLDAPGIAMLNIGSMQGANIQYAGFTGAQPFSIISTGAVTDTIVTSQESFKMVDFGSFNATTPGNATMPGSAIFTAPAISTFKIMGNMTGDLDLTGGGAYSTDTLGKGMIGGNVTGGHWHVTGNSWYVGANSFGTAWSGVQLGTIQNFKTTTDFSGNLDVGSIGIATIGRNMLNADVHFTYDYSPTAYNFNKWSIGNSMELSYMYGSGNFGTFKSQFMSDSSILAGVGPTFNFNGTNQFVSDAMFNSASIHCHSSMINFADSYMAAPSFGLLNLGMVQTPNSGITFGVRADKLIKQLEANFKNKKINIANVLSATSVQQALQAAGISTEDSADFATLFSD